VHRFQFSWLGSKFASDGGESDRLFGSNNTYFVGLVLAPRFFSQRLAQNISQQFASFTAGSPGNGHHRNGGFSMLLKMFVLSGSALILWLAPLTALEKKVGWHKFIQGLSLSAAVACAVSAGNIARKLAEEGEIETIKTRAITADVVDEIAVSAYISQSQRQQEAEQILKTGNRTDAQTDESEVELNSIKESLELLIQKTSSDSGELTVTTLTTRQQGQIESILQCHAKGITGKNKILKEVWGVSAGSSQAYRDAKAEYEFLLPLVQRGGGVSQIAKISKVAIVRPYTSNKSFQTENPLAV
jgi:hypothetical protein